MSQNKVSELNYEIDYAIFFYIYYVVASRQQSFRRHSFRKKNNSLK